MENYENLGTIGEGTYGVVMKARHRETGQIVAIKKFKESEDDDQVRKTALREVRILKQLRHENIVNLIEVFRKKGKLYLVFEHADHTILEDLDRSPQGMDDLELKKILYQLLTSIDFCHSHNIIHRDIKPENLLVTKNGVLKLCDFGFARVLGGPGAKYTDYVATRWYRAPELLVGDTEYSKPVDVWAIGCLFAELKNGAPLFPGESDIDQLKHIMTALGPIPKYFRDVFERNPLYINASMPYVSQSEVQTLNERFTQYTPEAMSFLTSCLAYDPIKRATTNELLKHSMFNGFTEWFQHELRSMIEKDASAQGTSKRRRNRKKEDLVGDHRAEHDELTGRSVERQSRTRESRDKENAGMGSKHFMVQYSHIDDQPEERFVAYNGTRSTLNSRGTAFGDDFGLPHSMSKESIKGSMLRVVAYPSLTSEFDDPSHDNHNAKRKTEQFPQISPNIPMLATTRVELPLTGNFPVLHDALGVGLNNQFDGIIGSGVGLLSERRKRNVRINHQLQGSLDQIRPTTKPTRSQWKGMSSLSPTSSLYQSSVPPGMSNMDVYISLPKSPNVDQGRSNLGTPPASSQYASLNGMFGKYAANRRF